jgi:hypothetical protein
MAIVKKRIAGYIDIDQKKQNRRAHKSSGSRIL